MKNIKLFSFQDAVSDSSNVKSRHALFCTTLQSSCMAEEFDRDSSGFLGLANYIEKVSNVFSDREVVGLINSIRKSNQLLGVYEGLGDALAFQLRKDSDFLRDLLASRVSSSLSACLLKASDKLTDQGFGTCLRFVSHFNSVFSQNFDMVPLWAKTQSIALQKNNNLSSNFVIKSDEPFEGPGQTTVSYPAPKFWFLAEGENKPGCSILPEQAVFLSARVRLVETISSAFAACESPLLDPLEHTNPDIAKMRHVEYLRNGRDAFTQLEGVLFVFARSLSELADTHLQGLKAGRIKKVFLSLFDGLNSPASQQLIEFLQATAISCRGQCFELACFDAESVWMEPVV